jgi:hypothetical protein
MAIQRISLAHIETAVLQTMGYGSNETAPWETAGNLYLRVNEYIQRLPQKATLLARQLGSIGPNETIRFDMWKTTAVSGIVDDVIAEVYVVAGSSTIYFPTDYDQIINLYDVTNKRDIPVVTEVDRRYIERLRNKVAGPSEAVEIGGFATITSFWRRKCTLYPAVAAAVVPSLTLTYWRIPAKMAGSAPEAEYPDIDPKFESLAIYGPICDLSRNTGFESARYEQLEKEMLTEMIYTARVY